MASSPRPTRKFFRTLLVLPGIAALLALAGVPLDPVSASKLPQPLQKQLSDAFGADRQAGLEKLYAQFKAGEPFSEEEGKILRAFGENGAVTELEADVVISRALFAFYIAGRVLTAEQEELLGRYSESVARRVTDVADLKRQLLNKRLAAAATVPPRTPLAAPANDLCSGAETIPGAGPFPILTSVTLDITDASLIGDPPTPSCQTCDGGVSRSIWYVFTPTTSAAYTISSCADATTATTVDDSVIAVYTSTGGCGGTFTPVPQGCDDDACVSENLQAVVSNLQLTAGTTYYIVVWLCGAAPPTAGNTAVQLRVSQGLPPANDTCSAPTSLLLNTPHNGTTQFAGNDYQLSASTCFDLGIGNTSSSASGRDVVYSFTAPNEGKYSFKVTGYDTSKQLVLYLATSCPTGVPPVTVATCLAAANRQLASTSEEVNCVLLTLGQTVFIYVDENSASDGSAFTIEATSCTPETEPNGTPGTAGANTFEVEGSIDPGGDGDFFDLGTPLSGSRVFAFVDGVASNSANFDMRVTTATDTLEYDDRDNDMLFGSLAPNVGGTPLNGVQSFIRINHNSTTTRAEPYRLYAVVQPPGANPSCACSATNEAEPNDTPGQATSASNNFFHGELAGPAPSTDVDFFSFTANVGDLIFLSLDGDPTRDNTPINGALMLIAPDGAIAVDDFGSTSSTTSGAGSLTATAPSSPAEALVWRATTTGTYFAKVFTNSTSSTGVGDYLLSISRNGQIPTLARFSSEADGAATAIPYEDGVWIRWRTQFEIDNLGFNIYREENGKRIRINQQIIAGSAFLLGSNTALGAGGAYEWFDNSPVSGTSQYWIESLDLSGENDLHGPIKIDADSGKAWEGKRAQSLVLSEIGQASGAQNQTAQVERKAVVRTMSPAGLLIQDIVAGQPAVKLSVKKEGLYRVSQQELAAVGFDPKQDLRNLRLFADGEEQPINVITGTGQFDSSAAIEFYGVGIDSAATDEHVYWLIAGSRPGQRMRRVAAPAGSGILASFSYAAELRQRTIYFSALLNGDQENFFGAVVSRDPVDQVLTLQHVDTAARNGATLEVALQGVTHGEHRVEVQINDSKAGEVVFAGLHQGFARLPVSQALLREGGNIVRLAATNGSGDISLVDYVRLTYWHTLVADNNQLRFTAGHNQAVSVDGFTNPDIRVFDVTSPNAAQEISGAIKPSKIGFSVTLRATGPGSRRLLAMTNDSAGRVANVWLNQPSGWRQTGNAADLVVFTRREFMMALEPLKALRESQGHRVAMVDVEDVFDEFSFGNKTPKALRDFLYYAHGNWSTGPRYVLLVGDASFDPKSYLGFGDNDLIPTKLIDTQFMETASDDWLADFDGEGLAAMAIGRLPVRSLQEAFIEVGKLIGYERGPTPQGVVLVADDGLEFEAPSNELRVLIPDAYPVEQINRGSLDPLSARTRLLDAINRGQRAINYNGHGNIDSWRGGLLSLKDVSSLSNQESLPVFMMMTCLNGYFHHAQVESLAESLMNRPNGGAVAVWASSGVTFPSDQGVMSIEMFRLLFDPNNQLTLGEVSRRARSASLNRDVRLTWILLGDPTTRLAR